MISEFGRGRGCRFDLITFRTYSTYSDSQGWANRVNPDQTLQNSAFDQVLYSLPRTQQFHTHSQVKMKILKYKIKIKPCE